MNVEFADLLETLCRAELTAEQQARLEQLVKADEELRREYVRYLHMHICLRRAYEQPGAAAPPGLEPGQPTLLPAPVLPGPASLPRRRAYHFRGLAAAAALLLVGCGLAWWFGPQRAAAATVATLTNARGCAWEQPTPPLPGTQLAAGRLELRAGVAEITCHGGAVVLIEAPAVVDLIDPVRGFLHAGRVVVRVPEGSRGFVLETQRARLTDHGTEFGVDVGNAGDTVLQVFDGVVLADCRHDPAQQRITAGQTVEINGQGKPRALTSTAERFIRRMPPANERGADLLVPYNQRRYDRVHIVPAPGPIAIDGDLTDWDRSGQFAIACMEPFSKDYYVEGIMMYDREFLYIGAHVGDPAPMFNVFDPATDPTVGWKGGAVQVRLSTDRSNKVLAAQSYLVPGHRLQPLDRSPQLNHLTMWYCKPKEEACLHVAWGMDFKRDAANPAGYRGTFRKDADGRGYTMEYAIPWSLLGVNADPPRGGDVLGACWNVHWSDEDGRLWKGYLVDITNPQEKGYTYQRAATWGQAIYHASGNLPRGTVAPR